MKKILIVDDEIICRLGIKALLDWEEYGYKIIGEASSGEEALLFMTSNCVDLLITDIRMPVMSGIDLIKEVKRQYPNTQSVVLSSFDDYEYVREALRLGALDYILKLDLNVEVLQGLIERIDDKVGNRLDVPMRDLQIFSSDVNKNYQRQLMRDLLYGRQTYSELKEKLKENHFELERPYIFVLEFDLGREFSDGDRNIIFPLLEEILDDYPMSYTCMTGDNTISILYNTHLEDNEARMKSVDSMSNRIIGVLSDYLNYNIIIRISDSSENMDSLAVLYLQVCQIKAMVDLHDKRKKLYYYEAREQYDKRDMHRFDDYIKRLREVQVENETDAVYGLINEINEYLKENHYMNSRETKHFMVEISSIVNWLCWKCTGKLLKEFTGYTYEVVDEISGMDDVYMYMERIMDVLEQIRIHGEGSYLVRKVKEYIDDNYGEKIQISVIADSMYVSNSYLSTLFKKETGETIKDYLIKTRVMHAKKMLKDSSMQIQEISRSVGCENEHYFSTMFKQRTGKSPKEYRSQ